MYNRQVLSLNSCNIEGRKILAVTCGMSKCVIKSNFLSGGNTEKSEFPRGKDLSLAPPETGDPIEQWINANQGFLTFLTTLMILKEICRQKKFWIKTVF